MHALQKLSEQKVTICWRVLNLPPCNWYYLYIIFRFHFKNIWAQNGPIFWKGIICQANKGFSHIMSTKNLGVPCPLSAKYKQIGLPPSPHVAPISKVKTTFQEEILYFEII